MRRPPSPDRAALAAAISERNEAAKAAEAAEQALVAAIGPLEATYGRDDARMGEKLRGLRTAAYDASERREALENELQEMQRRHFNDHQNVLRHFMRTYDGKTPDEVIGEAKAAEDKVLRQKVGLEIERDKLAFTLDEAERLLEKAKTAVNKEVAAVLDRQALQGLCEEAAAATMVAMGKLGALQFASRVINFLISDKRQSDANAWPVMHLYELFGQNSLERDRVPYYQARDEGEELWRAAYNRLMVDANAPLPAVEIEITEEKAVA